MRILVPPSELEMRRRSVFTVLSVIVGSLASAACAAIGLSYFLVPRGASIRPMDDAAFEFLFAGLAFLLGFLPGIGGLVGSRRRWAVLGVILSLAPIFLAEGLIRLAMVVKGFTFSP